QKLTRTVGADAPVTPAAEWKVAGTSVPKVDGRAMVTGKHKFSSDVSLPGMLFGKVLRPPTLTATLVSADLKAAQALPGVTVVHAPLEPRAAVAEWKDGKVTVWTGTQRPFGVKGDVARAFNLPQDRVRVITPDTGSGYGGKHTVETAVEAARLAKAAGKPVKLVHTREEEFTWAYFRPAGVIEVRAGMQKDGTLTAWDFHNYNSGQSAVQALYEAPQ